MNNGVVAIIGSPNVGKSTVFNRLVGERNAIVHDEAGVTRDRIYARAEWLTKQFSLIDTGGIEMVETPFQTQIRAQVEIAIQEADVIVFVTDGKIGLTGDDKMVARMLYKANKPVILAVNKIDDGDLLYNINEFYSLGLGDPIAISSAHGIGIGDLLDQIVRLLPEKSEEELIDEEQIRFCVIGRPNVGKSSLVNALLNQERVIVSDIAGTTRDAIDTPFIRNNQKYLIIDTAGLVRRGKIYESVDRYAALRALRAIEKSDIVLLVLDGSEQIREQDKHVVGYAMEAHKAIIIVVNKWDIVEKDDKTMNEFTKNIRKEFKFLDYAPIVFLSALTKKRVHEIFSILDEVNAAYHSRVSTSLLNDVVQEAQILNPAPYFNKGRVNIYFASQTSVAPPTFILFVNNPKFMHFSYQRFIENRLRDSFNLAGTPIKIICRERK
ncbi:MAG: ribosome biogenesis GTPase Der [Bacilli bacterium]|jgi:GTP-binding protein|nr:ribosome biogenesis GTPase Der [Bacilli bacterium]MDD3389139.1 ribosome biogenesis GTPase Der [Bacilli bacterium]MDD4344783.1 ribosome biogenesis GTPase Der [Bacilli bacterium]MDD4520893.1 ribosome biogenesis GTPase Der [Bacilli bacterium]MDY0399590.1 ribosome biogenesis GTPase Der [Bacilli bacterium]